MQFMCVAGNPASLNTNTMEIVLPSDILKVAVCGQVCLKLGEVQLAKRLTLQNCTWDMSTQGKPLLVVSEAVVAMVLALWSTIRYFLCHFFFDFHQIFDVYHCFYMS